MKRILLLCFTFFTAITFSVTAQRTVSGKVTDDTGESLPGVNVVIKGTTTGVTTDLDGNYRISVEDGAILIYSYVGFETQEIEIGARTTIDVTMGGATELQEVVVTVQGLDKSQKALGYAVTTLDESSIGQRPEADLVRSLNGKIPGVQITSTSGASGSGTNFIIRSRNSINGDNQPLFIVDGVPFDGGTNNQGIGFNDGGATASSRFLDLDPNNIESIQVLKGLSATVLYGQRGRNGVILVTTKSGSSGISSDKGFEITVNQTIYANEVSALPDYQQSWGQGADNIFNPAFVGNWGANFSDLETIPHPYDGTRNGNFGFGDVFPEFQGANIPYEFHDNAGDFFRRGFGSTTNIALQKSGENSAFNFNFGYTSEDGYVPENGLDRYNFGLGGTAKLGNGFSINSSLLYSNLSVTTPPIAANNAADALSIFERTLFVPVSVNLQSLPFEHPVTGESVYYRPDQDNPYWLLENSSDIQEVERVFLSTGLNYQVSDKISVSYSLGIDSYTELRERRVNRGSTENATYQQGYLRTTIGQGRIFNHRVVATISDVELSSDFGLSASLGGEARRDEFTRTGQSSTDQIVRDVFTHRNFVSQINNDPFIGNMDLITEENVLGVFGEVNFDFREQLFLNVSGRNDWASTLEPGNRTLFYPSASLSWLPTASFAGFGGDRLDFLKVRASYGTSARFPAPYNTRPILVANANEFQSNDGPVSTNTAQATAANANLQPELQEEIELGVESRLFNNRLGFDFTFFRRISEDQIINQALDPSTGFANQLANAGTITTNGVELVMTAIPVQVGDFQWTMTNIFDAYETTVTDLPADALVIAGFTNLGNFAENDQPLNVFKGSYALRDDEGNLLINPNDGKIFDSNDFNLPIEIAGDPNPDWKLTSINSFSYKGITLSAQMEYVHGGDMYSQTVLQLLRRGVTTDTEGGRENTWVIPGVLGDPETGEALLDEGGNKIPNNIQLGANDLYFINLVDPGGQAVFDASHVRLREVSLSYALPREILSKTPFGSVSVTLAGQNLWFHTFNIPSGMNFDPEQLSTGVGNGQGLDFQTGPTTRRYSASLKFTF